MQISSHRLFGLALLVVLGALVLAFSATPQPSAAQGPGTITLEEVLTLGDGSFTAMALSADDRRLAVGLATGELQVYNLASTDASPDLTQRFVLAAHDGPITSMAFNGPTTIATTSATENAVKIWNLQNRALQTGLAGPAGSQVAYSPDGRWLALGVPNESKVDVLNATTFERQYVVETRQTTANDGVLAMDFSPEGNRLVFSTRNAGVFLVDVVQRAVLGNYIGTAPLSTVRFTPGAGSNIVGTIGAPTQSYILLDAATMTAVGTTTNNDPAPDGRYDREAFAVTFSNDGAFRVGTANRQTVDAAGQRLLAGFALLNASDATANYLVATENAGLDIALTSDARFIYGLTANGLYRFSVSPTEIQNGVLNAQPVFLGSAPVYALDFSNDNARLLTVNYNAFGAAVTEYSLPDPNAAPTNTTPAGQILSTAQIPGLGEIDFAAYATSLSQSNDLILRGHDQNDPSATVITTSAGSVRVPMLSAIARDGRIITAQDNNITVQQVNASTQTFDQFTLTVTYPVTGLLLSTNGNILAVRGDGQQLTIFDLNGVSSNGTAPALSQVTISPNVITADGFALANNGFQALAWGTNTQGQQVATLLNMQNGANLRSIAGIEVVAAAAAPSFGPAVYAVLTADGQLRLLDSSTLEERAAFPTAAAYTHLTWSNDGTFLALHGGPGVVRVLRVTEN